MSETNQMPKVAQLGQVAQGLDTVRLLELAKSKLDYARNELDRIRREHAMKMAEIGENARVKMEDIRRETADAVAFLEVQTEEQARPAKEMIALVESMINYKR